MTGKLRSRTSFLVILFVLIICTVFPARSQNNGNTGAKAGDQTKFALLVGITNYPEGLNKIDGCVNNVPLLAETLVGDYGFDEKNVVSLLDKDAKYEAIIARFRNHLIENAKRIKSNKGEAVIVFYFCGHGAQTNDLDGDENEPNDDKDETLVAYDSRSAGNYDILDDEIDDLKAELRQFTTNATFILESCHSGTGTRGTQFISEEADDDKRNRPPYKRKFPASGDKYKDTYAEIAASLSTRSALSESAEFCKCKPYSLMTKALVQALKRTTPSTTYRGLVSEIADEVSLVSKQEPQVEGNRDKILFLGAAKRSEPYIKVLSIGPDGRIEIGAGAIHGLKEGSQVSFYSSGSQTNRGKEDGWLVNGVVISVNTKTSFVSIPKPSDETKRPTIEKTSHAVLASPVFGGGSILVSLLSKDPRSASSDEVAVRSAIEEELRADDLVKNQIIKIAADSIISPLDRRNAKSVIRLRKGTVKDVFWDRSLIAPIKDATYRCVGTNPEPDLEAPLYPAADAEVYYLDNGNDTDPPLFGITFDPASTDVATKISDAITRIALQQNLRGLNNAASTLTSSVDVKFESAPGDAIKTKCKDGKLWYEQNKGFAEMKENSLPIGSLARITVTNISGKVRKKKDPSASGERLYVTILVITTMGKIQVFSLDRGDAPFNDGITKSIGVRGAPPVGVDHYLIVVSRDYVDFSFYESWNVKTRGHVLSPLEKILRQSGTATRDTRSVVDEPDSWGVIRLDVNIVKDEHVPASLLVPSTKTSPK